MRILDLREHSWEHDKLDHEFYKQFRKFNVEAGSVEEENEEGEDKDATTDEDDGDHEYKSVVDVCGLDLKLSSDNPDILQKAALSLTEFFQHYVIPSSQ